MMIDWNNFTPWSSLIGGMLIGLATAILLLMNGRIAGISGILGGLLRPVSGDIGWRVLFIVGLVLAPVAYQVVEPLPAIKVTTDSMLLATAGVLVGLGTRYGSGCTSGHGVSGLSRRSMRSLVATIAFMFAGFATVFAVRHFV